MNDTRLAELREKYQDRNLMEELAWGTYASHSGYVNKANGEFINWLCNSAYRELKKSDRPQGEWIMEKTLYGNYNYRCNNCDWHETHAYPDCKPYNFCPNCGADMREREGE